MLIQSHDTGEDTGIRMTLVGSTEWTSNGHRASAQRGAQIDEESSTVGVISSSKRCRGSSLGDLDFSLLFMLPGKNTRERLSLCPNGHGR